MGTREGTRRPPTSDWSWTVVSILGLLMLCVPLYDMYDDVSNLSWGFTTTLVENSVLIALALGLVYGGVWLARLDWDPEYKRSVVKWNLGVAAGIAALYALVIALQLWAMGSLKPWILALDGVLFGSVAAFAVGTYSARNERVNDELARSREEYRTLTDDVLDTSEVATFILDSAFNVVWTNQATANYFGLDREAILGHDKRELVEEQIAGRFAEPERFRERVTATYDDNTYTEQFECHMLESEDTDERWLEHWSQPIENGLYEGGRIEHYSDITAIKERERELDLRERKLRELYDIISDPSMTFNDKAERLVDIGRELFDAEYGSFACIDQESGEYTVEAVHADDADIEAGDVIPLGQTHCERTVLTERTLQFETRPFDVEEKDYGTDAGFETYVGTPVYENNNIYGTLCFLDREESDPFDDWQLTMVELMGNWMGYELNRKHLLEERQQRLREQEAKLAEFVDTVDNYAIFTLDTEGLVTSWNAGAEQIKGYSKSEIVGEHFSVFYPEENVEADLPEELLTEAAETGQATHEGWRVRKDGSRFWANVTIAARYEDGEHVGYTKVVEDRTEQRERERTLEHERERLEFMNRIIRHNILNGLNVVGARTRYLDGEDVTAGEADDHLETVIHRVEDMTAVIDTMRTFMDAVLEEADHETEPVSLREALNRKVTLARDTYDDAVFETDDLPDPDVEVRADELVGEVFENVLSNAVVHNDADTPRVDVWTTETTHQATVDAETGEVVPAWRESAVDGNETEERPAIAVHIADDGPGIPDDQKEQILEKGVSELSEPGNGFGLYLVKEMMAAYSGAVDVRDSEMGGTEFELVFLQA